MMRDKADLKDALDIAALQPRPREPPELAPVIAFDANLPDDMAEHDQRTPDIVPGQTLLAVRDRYAVAISFPDLVLEAGE
jgi:hypothetical protein